MFGLGPGELVVILALALLIFGPKKLPEIGRSIGTAMRELRRASNDFMSAVEQDDLDEPETEVDRGNYLHQQKPEHVDEEEAERRKDGE